MSSLSVQDFRRKPKADTQSANLANVHVRVEDYLRDDSKRAYAVQGINLKDGKEVTIRLADAEQFARLYMNPKQEMSVRVEKAEKQIEKRTTMAQLGAARGNKAVPVGGVISISNVRPDMETGELYGRWPNAVVTDPEKEVALMAAFEIRTTIAKDKTGKDFKTAFIQALMTDQAVSSNDVSIDDFNRMLSGKLGDTGAELRTNIAVTVQLDGETATYALRPKQIKTEDGYETSKGIEQALAGEFTRTTEAVAAAAIAAKAGVDFEKLNINLSNAQEDTMDNLRSLYDGVKSGQIPATFIPGATLQPSRYTVDAILGQKRTDNGIVEAKTQEQGLTDRGFVHGVLGLRYISNETGEVVPPVVKAVFTDDRVPAKDSDYFTRYDLSAVGHDAFMNTHDEIEQAPKLGQLETSNPSTSAKSKPVPAEASTDLDDDEELDFSDSAPNF